MKVPFTVGVVGHFGLAVPDPQRSAKWFGRALGLKKEFEFDGGVAIGNDNVTIALFKGKPSPRTIEHMSFHLMNMSSCERRCSTCGALGPSWKIRAMRSVRRRQDLHTWDFGSTIRTVIAGSFPCRVASNHNWLRYCQPCA
jgi:hypothetical protein